MTKSEIFNTKQWTYDPNRKPGATRLNLEFLRELIDLCDEFGKQAMMLYFLNVELGIHYVWRMQKSVVDQRGYIMALIENLKKYQVEKCHEKAFRRDIGKLKARLVQVNRIVREDVHLTEFEPFFDHVSWESLNIDELPTTEDMKLLKEQGITNERTNPYEQLMAQAVEWNEQNKDKVEEHMRKVAPEIERHTKYKQRVKEQLKAEKAAIKAARKAEDAEIKEMKKNAQAHRSRYKKLERSFERYYKRG